MKTRSHTTPIRRAFTLFWHGLTGLLGGIAGWITTLLGMNDDSKYSRILRRTVGTCFAVTVFLLTVVFIGAFCSEACRELRRYNRERNEVCLQTRVSPHVAHYYAPYSNEGFVMNSDGKKTLRNIHWVARPRGRDSLVCYSNGQKRGYFNKNTGYPVIEARFRHAWVFSEGLAAVDDNGYIKFIDPTGKVVIDPQVPYDETTGGHVFHSGYCIMHNAACDSIGLIDRQGNWALPPVYTSIRSVEIGWIVSNGRAKCLLDPALNTLIPFLEGQLWVGEECIHVTLDNHIMQRYAFDGTQIEALYINDVTNLTYETDELRYPKLKHYSEEGVPSTESEEQHPLPVEKTARCKSYESESGWHGLMDPDGRVITPPAYWDIKAIGYDLYLCKDNGEDGIVLNGRGERVR